MFNWVNYGGDGNEGDVSEYGVSYIFRRLQRAELMSEEKSGQCKFFHFFFIFFCAAAFFVHFSVSANEIISALFIYVRALRQGKFRFRAIEKLKN